MRLVTLFLFFFIITTSTAYATRLDVDVRSSEPSLQQIVKGALTTPLLSQKDERLNRQRLGSYQRQLPTIVKEIIEPYGYFYSTVSTRLEQPAADHFRIIIEVEAGEPLAITKFNLDLSGAGSNHPALQRLINQFPLRINDILRQDLYEQGKAGLRQAAAALGYLDASFEVHLIEVYLQERRAEIDLRFNTGEQYHFGAIRYVDRAGYPERFLKRFVSYHQGDVFSYSLLGKTQVNLMNADLFSSVSVQAKAHEAENYQVPVEIALLPLPRHRLRPGIGYGTDTGGRVSLDYRHLNLWEAAHELVGKLLIAQWRQQLQTTYIIPDRRRLDSLTLLTVGTEREDVDAYYRREVFGEAEYRRSFGRGYRGSLFVRATSERSRVADSDRRTQLLLQGFRLSWQQLDHPMTPERGSKIQLQVQGADENWFSDTSLLQLTVDAATLIPLPQRFSVFFRLGGGTTWHRQEFNILPVSLRYFAGGDRSVRGFKYNSLGPVNEDGEVVGGKHLLVGSVELEKRFLQRWGFATFYDVGNAFDSFNDYELKQGAGLGIRYFTQIGAIRLDVARQLGEKDNGYRLHFSLGLAW
ncbi:autotransporter assembly complex protein TamA [Pelovirga terrestris]|uniref:Translocation and assembly module subunit TamA n=1 Tax=Pelovirga terrestris TaxID=2771352 RepID=A0A8J6UKA6_9BACT|nr:BamA/TamA family outer membrane protein [Pelovirga terrestris]MBD1399152.1 BamA/TamA family outer membrane protein [Pelovirga terrestris]